MELIQMEFKLACKVGAMLLVFIAFITMGNYLLCDVIRHYTRNE